MKTEFNTVLNEVLSQEELDGLRKIQKTLLVISMGEKVFFNISVFVNRLGLVKEVKQGLTKFGTQKFPTKWALTEKGERLLNTII